MRGLLQKATNNIQNNKTALQERKKEIEDQNIIIQELTQKNTELSSKIPEFESTIEGIKQENEKKVSKLTLQFESLISKKEEELKQTIQKLDEVTSTFEDYKLKAYSALKEVEVTRKKFEEEEKGTLLQQIEDLKGKVKEFSIVKKQLEESNRHIEQIEQELNQSNTQQETLIEKCKETEKSFAEHEIKSQSIISTLKNEILILQQNLNSIQTSEKLLQEQYEHLSKENRISSENYAVLEQQKLTEISDLQESIKVNFIFSEY